MDIHFTEANHRKQEQIELCMRQLNTCGSRQSNTERSHMRLPWLNDVFSCRYDKKQICSSPLKLMVLGDDTLMLHLESPEDWQLEAKPESPAYPAMAVHGTWGAFILAGRRRFNSTLLLLLLMKDDLKLQISRYVLMSWSLLSWSLLYQCNASSQRRFHSTE